jgi:hypothetical protein
MHGVAGVGSEVTGSTMASTEVSIGLAAHESASGSGLGRSGYPTGVPTRTIRTRPWWSTPHSRCRSSLGRHHPPGITATTQGGITPMSSSVPADGERWPQRRLRRHPHACGGRAVCDS